MQVYRGCVPDYFLAGESTGCVMNEEEIVWFTMDSQFLCVNLRLRCWLADRARITSFYFQSSCPVKPTGCWF